MWRGGINRQEAEQLRAAVDDLMETPYSGTQVGYLTRLETRIDPGYMTDDIKLTLESEPSRFTVSLRARKGYDSPVTSKETELIAASQVGERERVKELLASGAEVDAIIESSSKIIPLEMKWTSSPRPGDAGNDYDSLKFPHFKGL